METVKSGCDPNTMVKIQKFWTGFAIINPLKDHQGSF